MPHRVVSRLARPGRRVVRFAALVLLASIAAFALQSLLAGDAATFTAAESGDPSAEVAVRAELGLDAPAPVRFMRWAGAAARGDFGRSSATGEPVADMIKRAVRVTLELAIVAQIVAVTVGFAFALMSVVRIGGRLDALIRALSFALLATPGFAVAALLLAIFAVRLQWLPAVGFVPITENFGDNLRSMVLPSLTLGVPIGALIARVLRVDLVASLSSDHVTLCRAMGYSRWRIIVGHALRISSINVSSFIGLEFARLLGGTLIIEQVFALPGLGRLAVQSVGRRDQPVVQALVIIAAIGFLAVAQVVDALHRRLDPRLHRIGENAPS